MAVTENPLSYTDSSTFSLHPRDGIDTWGVHGYAQTNAKSDNFKNDHRPGGRDDWQAQSPQKSHPPKFKGGRRNETILTVMSQWIVEHQIGML